MRERLTVVFHLLEILRHLGVISLETYLDAHLINGKAYSCRYKA